MKNDTPLSENELKAIAKQLACPHGEQAQDYAEKMAVSNHNMIEHAVDNLQLDVKNAQNTLRVLELGFGSGIHVPWLLAQADNLHYIGLEKSADMYQMAVDTNQALIDTHDASFYLFDGTDFSSIRQVISPVDRIFTVNTLYFWENPATMLSELAQLLKPNGIINMTFCEQAFLQTLPFTRFGFSMYDEATLINISQQVGLTHLATFHDTDNVISKAGDDVERSFITMSLQH